MLNNFIKNDQWRRWFFLLGIIGALQFLALTLGAMWVYDGGTLHAPEQEFYSFWYNYFSDLGRTRNFRGESNWLPQLLFKIALSVSGLFLILFFIALPGIFQSTKAKTAASVAAFFGIVAGGCYIGIANVPWNIDYWQHVHFVRLGFLAFLLVTLFYTAAILLEKKYPRRYALAFLAFAIILGVQINIMFFGPRAWRSEEALFLQVVAQKVVVYAQILCLLYQCIGAYRRTFTLIEE